jgi:hypothetical protein
MAPSEFQAGGYPQDFARFWALWLALAVATVLFVRASRRRQGKPSLARLVAGNLLVFLTFLWTVVCLGETYLRYVYDATDSYGLTLTNISWFRRHMLINQDGFRDEQFDRPVPAGADLVACVGDSFTQGWGIDDPADCWPQRIGAALAAREPGKWHVRNYGLVGTSTGDQLGLVRDLCSRGGVRRIVLGYCLNDADDLAPKGRGFDRADAPQVPWLDRTTSFVADFLWFRMKLRDDPRVRGYFGWVGEQYADERIMARHTAQFREMRQTTLAAGVRLDVVVFPMFAEWGPSYRFDPCHESVARAWSSVGVDVLDLREAYRGIPASDLVVNRLDGHPNETALEIAATTILTRLFPKK